MIVIASALWELRFVWRRVPWLCRYWALTFVNDANNIDKQSIPLAT